MKKVFLQYYIHYNINLQINQRGLQYMAVTGLNY